MMNKSVLIFLASLVVLPLYLYAQKLPEPPGEVPSVYEQEYREYETKHGYRSRRDGYKSEWNLDGVSTLGFQLGFFSQPAVFSGRPGADQRVDVQHTVATGLAPARYPFVYTFNGLDWAPNALMPEIVYRYYHRHGLALGISLGHSSANNKLVAYNAQSNFIDSDVDGAYDDTIISYARLESSEKMSQMPLFFFLQMDTKPSMALKPNLSVGLGFIKAKASRAYTMSTDTNIDTNSNGVVDSAVSTLNQAILSESYSRTIPAGRVQFGLEWTSNYHNVIRLSAGYQAAFASESAVSTARNASTTANRGIGPFNFSGLIFSAGIDFWW
ncbi:MAG: hypothetical protein HY747_03335 [Elusimicrobia bacterium]|nr:hypothetical protein [Elusimicrobiota bacterium]